MTMQSVGIATANSPPKPGAARTRLLLEGPIVSTLLRLAAPNLVVNVVLIAVTTSIDAYFVGQLGVDALAGLSLVFPMMMLMQQMANSSMGGAIAAAVARAIGAGRRHDAAALVVHAVVIGCAAAALFTAVFVLAGPSLYRVLGGRGLILDAALEYSNAIFAGAVAYWVLSALTSAVRGTGQVALLAWVYLGAEVLHVVLVPTLVFGLGPVPSLGISGAGIATVTSFTASSAVLAWYLASGRAAVRLSLGDLGFSRRLFREILRVGAPMSLQPIFNNLALAAITAYASLLGATALAGFGVAVRLEYLLYPIVFGVGAAVLAMVGTNIGARQYERAARIAWIATGLSACVMATLGLLVIAWPGAWTGLFSDDPAVHAAAASYLCIVGLAYVFVAPNTLISAFQSTGQPQFPLLASGARLVVVVAGGWIAFRVGGATPEGLGIVTAAGLAVMGTILAVSFRRYARLHPPAVERSSR
jgi:putative MATE family efflux protein